MASNPAWDQPGRTRGRQNDLREGAATDGLSAQFDEAGLGIAFDPREFGFWGKITGRSGPLYSWQEVQQDGSGANWITAAGGAFSGGFDAYEENGSTSVASGRVVWLRRTSGLGGQAFAFKDDGAGGGGTPPAMAHGNLLLSADIAINSFSPITLLTATIPFTGVYLFLATVPIVCTLTASKWAAQLTSSASNLLAYVAGANNITTGTIAPQYHASLQQLSNGNLTAGSTVTLAAKVLDGSPVTAAGSSYGGALGGTCLNYVQVA